MPVMLTPCALRLDVQSEYHEKRRKSVYAVTWPGQRLSREEFEQLRSVMEAGGGWYGRAFKAGGVPARFLFLSREAAEETATRAQFYFSESEPSGIVDDAPF